MVFKKVKKEKEMSKDQQIIDEEGKELHSELPLEPEDLTAKLEESLALEKDKYLRLVAEFENFKKRNLKERIELLKSAGEEMITSILPILDDFERAIQAGPLAEGIDLIYNKLVNILSQKGLKAMESKGKNFDADLQDAIASVPVEDASMKGKVIEEIEKGYYLNDKVIRHAKVVVGN
jgi:molecular chaperone GrpE